MKSRIFLIMIMILIMVLVSTTFAGEITIYSSVKYIPENTIFEFRNDFNVKPNVGEIELGRNAFDYVACTLRVKPSSKERIIKAGTRVLVKNVSYYPRNRWDTEGVNIYFKHNVIWSVQIWTKEDCENIPIMSLDPDMPKSDSGVMNFLNGLNAALNDITQRTFYVRFPEPEEIKEQE